MAATKSMPHNNTRAGYIAGLRALADLLEQHNEDDLPLPYHGSLSPVAIFTRTKEQMALLARAIPGKVTKTIDEKSAAYGFELRGAFAGLNVVVYGNRNQVCRRVVTGTREVTKTVPIISGHETVTETVEDVDWVCSPLLAERVA